MKNFYALVLILLSTLSFGQVIAKWDFDYTTPLPTTPPYATTTGTGTLNLIGGAQDNTQTGATACNCPFVAGNPATGKAYSTKTYPAQGTASGTAGFKFAVSTVGQANINLYIDVFGSNTASGYVQLQYTTDGANWTNATPQPTVVPHDGTTSNKLWASITAAMPTTAANNANFAFRLVSVFAPGTSNYTTVKSGSTYAETGALRVDNVIVSNGLLAIEKLQDIAGLTIYPNPAKEILTITSDSFAPKQVEIYTTTGNKVIATTVNNTSIDTSMLTQGVYVIKVIEEDKIATQKLIIE